VHFLKSNKLTNTAMVGVILFIMSV